MRNVQPIGDLAQDPHIPEWWTSRPISVPYFSGAKLSFTITVESVDANYPPEISDAIREFLLLADRDRIVASERVFKNYRDFVDAVEGVDLVVNGSSEIWRYVRPTEVYIRRRNRRDKEIYVQVACECEWEIEHGLQLVFRRGQKLTRVSSQDGHLTHADAYDLPEPYDDEEER